jgi:hypothetical protein
MFGQFHPAYFDLTADMAYRREQVIARHRFPRRPRQPRQPSRRRWSARGRALPPANTQPTVAVLGAPHHVTAAC